MVREVIKIILGEKLTGKLSRIKSRLNKFYQPIREKLHQIFFVLFGKRCYSVIVNGKQGSVSMGYVSSYIFCTKEEAQEYFDHVSKDLPSIDAIEMISWWTRNPYQTSKWRNVNA